MLELPYGIEGFAPTRHSVKENGSHAEVGDTLDFKVLEFSKDDRRILMSHTNVHSTPIKEDKPVAKKSSSPKTKVKEAEKSTLGDLDALTNLKKQMVADQKAPAAKAEPKKAAKAKKEEAPKADESAEEAAEG